MVPDGLVLLTSLAFMAGVVKLSRRNALLRELASGELLARVDNLFDRVHAGSVIVNDGNARYFEPGAPRNFLLGVRLVGGL